jgi:isopropylmalate/homocitrate/citramalate synthase
MSVRICDVGPRDGLQNHPEALSAAQRAELCRRLAGAGVRHVEAVSFVREDRVPQMASAEAVLAELSADPKLGAGTTWSALVLNTRGYVRAEAAGVREIHLAVMATEAFSMRNCNATVEQSMRDAGAIIERAHTAGARVATTVSVAFGCPFEGLVAPHIVVALAERLVAAGTDELMLADTIGCAMPRQVGELLDAIGNLGVPLGVHLHNTRNAGYTSALRAVEHGATILEASLGGLGGCPFAPAATGNVATEDLVDLLHGEGIQTNIEVEALIDAAAWLETLLDMPLPGYLHRAGTFPAAPERRAA